MKSLVSIITPTFNSSKFLYETAQSVFNQTYRNWEWVITDDCSEDNTMDLLNELMNIDDRIKVFKLKCNSGSGIARNNSINKAIGKYIAFLDSDDIWHNEKLENHIAFMEENNALFSHTSYGFIDENSNLIKETFHVSKSPVTYRGLLKRTEISCLTAVYDADSLGKRFMSTHRRKQDYALWLSILKSGVNSIGLDEELAFYRQSAGSATSNKFKLIGKHISFLRVTQNMNLFVAIYYTFYWAINGLFKYYIR